MTLDPVLLSRLHWTWVVAGKEEQPLHGHLKIIQTTRSAYWMLKRQ
jgi:hypothetical protein